MESVRDRLEHRQRKAVMNQRTLEDVAIPTTSPLTTPDRIGTNLVATANTPANYVSGVIIAITSSSVTVRRRGAASTYAITPETTFTEDRKAITVSDLTFGEHVGIQAAPSRTPTAANINIQPAVLAGKVTALSDNKITIENEERVSRRIVVNALTTFARSDVATSLSELSIGSLISARGWFDATLSHLDASSVTIDQPDRHALPNGGFG